MTTALVLSAGGMFAAWEVGVWKTLRERIQFDIVVGVSAGAWNGWSIAGGATPEQLESEWMNPRMAELMKVGLHRSGWLRPEGLYERAREFYARARPIMPFGLTIVEVPRMRLHLVRNGEITWRHLAATCSIPLSYPPVEIDGKWYVDGGAMGALPLWAAEEMGATHAIGVNCLTNRPFQLLRAVTRPRRPTPKLAVTVIEPRRPLGSLKAGVVWSRENVRSWIEQGVEDANRAMSSVRM